MTKLETQNKEAKRFFLATWQQLTDLEGKNINIPVAVQKEMIANLEARFAEIQAELAQELLDMEVA